VLLCLWTCVLLCLWTCVDVLLCLWTCVLLCLWTCVCAGACARDLGGCTCTLTCRLSPSCPPCLVCVSRTPFPVPPPSPHMPGAGVSKFHVQRGGTVAPTEEVDLDSSDIYRD
jgi:hypothetical protein